VDRAAKKKFEISDDFALNCSDLIPFPNFHMDKMPFLISRTLNAISIIDLKQRQVYKLHEEEKPEYDNNFMSIVSQEGGVCVAFSSKKNDSSTDIIKSFLI